MIDIRIVVNDQRKIVNRVGLANVFNNLEPGEWHISFRQHKKRSLSQNAYFHSVMVPMVYDGLRDAGFDDVRTHLDAKKIIKSLFLKKTYTNKSDGLMIDLIQDTSEISRSEFSDLIEAVAKWSAEYLGVVIPMPNQQLKFDLND